MDWIANELGIIEQTFSTNHIPMLRCTFPIHDNNNNNPSGQEGAIVVEMEPLNNNHKETNIIQEMVQENDEGNNVLPYHDNSNWHIGISYHDQQQNEQENVHQKGN
ncbi:hypothetical protein LIER_01547 [Lithospermum erythrorhizon]|uniref:Uncharacterized protein n=1 Tax=Lithospermum erythrorhizon TaxID=34254 RepID=A0AAV3NMB5_LITER